MRVALLRRRLLLLLLAGVMAAAVPTVRAQPATALPAPPGSLSRLVGPTHCLALNSHDPSCLRTAGFDSPVPPGQVALSPNGRTVAFVIPGSSTSPTTVQLARLDPTSDTFSPVRAGGCLAVSPGTRGCVTVRAAPPAPNRVGGLVFSPDGRSAYLWTGAHAEFDPMEPASGSIVVLRSDPASGSLTPVPGTGGCLTDNGSDGAGRSCVPAGPLGYMQGLAISPDGRSVYAAGQDVVLSYLRDPATGVLTPGGCVAPDDRPVAGCRSARGLLRPRSPLVSADGRSVYVGSAGANEDRGPGHRKGVIAFSRAASGQLAQLPGASGCVLNDGADGCAPDPDLASSTPIGVLALSSDGQTLYAMNDGVRTLARDGAGGLSFPAGLVAGLDGALSCAGARDLFDHCPPLETAGTIDAASLSMDGRTLAVSTTGPRVDGLATFTTRAPGAGLQESGCLLDDGILLTAPGRVPRCATAGASIFGAQFLPGSGGLLVGESNRLVVLAPGLSALPATARVTRGARALVGVRCEAQAPGICRGTVTLRAGDSNDATDSALDPLPSVARPVGVSLAPGHDAVVGLRLDQRGRDELRARRSLDVRVRATATGATGTLESEAVDRLSLPRGGLLGGRRASACLPADALPLARNRDGRIYGRGVDGGGELYVYGCLFGRRPRHLDAHGAEPTYVRPPTTLAGPFAAFRVARSVVNADGTASVATEEVRVTDLRNGRTRALRLCYDACGVRLEIALRPSGALAFLANGNRVVVLEPGRRPRTVARHPGGGLSGLRLRGTKLSWVYRGRRQRSVPLR